jgi:3D (Asp-Asp-Asp) domain-containing protein
MIAPYESMVFDLNLLRMRDFLKRVVAFANCLVAALPVFSVRVTANSFIPTRPEAVEICLPEEVAPHQAFPREINSCLMVKVTAYAAVPRCTKKINPDITACGHRITRRDHYHLIALSPDLATGFTFGDRFRLEVGGKSYFVEYSDKMPDQHRESIDFLLPGVKLCKVFGVKTGKLSLLTKTYVPYHDFLHIDPGAALLRFLSASGKRQSSARTE